MAALWGRLAEVLLLQRGHLIGWAPVCMGAGIAIYFALPQEPLWWGYAGVAAALAFCSLLARLLGPAVSPLAVGAGLIALGLLLAGARAHTVSGPVMGWRYYGPVEGRVIGIDRSASDAARVTLDQVRLPGVRPSRTPDRVRLSLHSDMTGAVPRPGLRMGATGHLSPPSGPVEPGGFDFQRHAWFQGLGAVGYTRVPLVALAPPDGGQLMFRIRMALSARVQAALPGETGAFAAAIMTGDRSGMGQDTLTALRVPNLRHLLAISGCIWACCRAFVFATLRYGLALMSDSSRCAPLSSRSLQQRRCRWRPSIWPCRGAVSRPSGRSSWLPSCWSQYVEPARPQLARCGNRRADCAVLRPRALTGPGFQMSFRRRHDRIDRSLWLASRTIGAARPRWLRPVLAVVISSGVAGFATAPSAGRIPTRSRIMGLSPTCHPCRLWGCW